jgi:hypothetical protein
MLTPFNEFLIIFTYTVVRNLRLLYLGLKHLTVNDGKAVIAQTIVCLFGGLFHLTVALDRGS